MQRNSEEVSQDDMRFAASDIDITNPRSYLQDSIDLIQLNIRKLYKIDLYVETIIVNITSNDICIVPDKSGAYIIRNASKIRWIGSTKNLQRRLYGHPYRNSTSKIDVIVLDDKVYDDVRCNSWNDVIMNKETTIWIMYNGLENFLIKRLRNYIDWEYYNRLYNEKVVCQLCRSRSTYVRDDNTIVCLRCGSGVDNIKIDWKIIKDIKCPMCQSISKHICNDGRIRCQRCSWVYDMEIVKRGEAK